MPENPSTVPTWSNTLKQVADQSLTREEAKIVVCRAAELTRVLPRDPDCQDWLCDEAYQWLAGEAYLMDLYERLDAGKVALSAGDVAMLGEIGRWADAWLSPFPH